MHQVLLGSCRTSRCAICTRLHPNRTQMRICKSNKTSSVTEKWHKYYELFLMYRLRLSTNSATHQSKSYEWLSAWFKSHSIILVLSQQQSSKFNAIAMPHQQTSESLDACNINISTNKTNITSTKRQHITLPLIDSFLRSVSPEPHHGAMTTQTRWCSASASNTLELIPTEKPRLVALYMSSGIILCLDWTVSNQLPASS